MKEIVQLIRKLLSGPLEKKFANFWLRDIYTGGKSIKKGKGMFNTNFKKVVTSCRVDGRCLY